MVEHIHNNLFPIIPNHLSNKIDYCKSDKDISQKEYR